MNMRITGEIGAAFAQFFFMGSGPSHSSIGRVFGAAGLNRFDPYDPQSQTPNKQQRVLSVFGAAERGEGDAKALVTAMLDALRLHGAFRDSSLFEEVRSLKGAINQVGWSLEDDGRLGNIGQISLDTGGRVALEEQMLRLTRNLEDPAALLGGAKELLEAVAKFVLEEGGRLPDKKLDFPILIALSFEQLGFKPAVVDEAAPGGKQVRAIYQSARTVVTSVNELRNLQGTGHGRTLPTGVSAESAVYVVREATHVAELMLRTHDRQMGRQPRGA